MTNLYAALNLPKRSDPLTRALDDVALLWAFGEVTLDTAFALARAAHGITKGRLARAWSAMEVVEVKRGGNSDRKAMRANLRALGEASV